MTETTVPVPCKTKYVYIEMILNKESSYDVVAGLFKGIYEKENETFILLHGLKNATHALNLKYYNIMMIEERVPDYKNMVFLNSSDVDQTNALQMLAGHYETLTAAGYVVPNDPKILDTEKYTDVPEEYLKEQPVGATKNTSNVNGVGNYAAPGTHYVAGQVNNFVKKAYVKPDPEPTTFTRTKTKKPTPEQLSELIEKIGQIMAGTYDAILPPNLPADDAEEAGKPLSYDDDEDPYGSQFKGVYGF
jgi:hypothetical protein